ncbi:MAG: MDR family MFS transporter [Thermoleophilia bacterium]
MTGLSRKQKVFTMSGVGLGMLLAALDQTIIATAMPQVVAHLGGFDLYAWAFTAYMLTSTASVPLYGKLSDLYGRKIFFLLGMILFTLGSAASGQAQTMHQLIGFRALQGLGAGAMMPVALAIIGDLFPPGQRGKVQGMMGTIFGISSIVGPMVGGYITDNLSWRWVFYVNLPVGVLAVFVVLLTMPWDRRAHRQHTIDYLGAAALVGGVVPLLLAFSQAGVDHAWTSSYILSLFFASAVMLSLFAWAEVRAKEPILPLSLFRNPIFFVSVFVVFLTAMGMFGSIMFIPLFAQGVTGASATNSGYVLTPMMLSMIAGSIGSGQLVARWGRYRIIGLIGLALMTLGMYLLSRMDAATTCSALVRNMVVTGFGLGTTMPLYVIAVQNAFPHALLGVVTSSIQFFRSIGGTIGVAVLGSLMNRVFREELMQNLASGSPAGTASPALEEFSSPQALLDPEAAAALKNALPPQLAEQFLDATRTALAGATGEAFLLGTALVAAAWALNWLLKEIPLRRTHEEAAAGRPAEEPLGEPGAAAAPGAAETV